MTCCQSGAKQQDTKCNVGHVSALASDPYLVFNRVPDRFISKIGLRLEGLEVKEPTQATVC